MQDVYVIEDEVLLRDLVLDLLKSHRDLNVVGSSTDGKEGLKDCLRFRPQLVILDVRLPSLNGVEIAQQLKTEFPAMKILVFSGAFNLGILKRLMVTRVNGIIEKAAGLEEMQKAINAVVSGQSYYSPSIVERMPELLTAREDVQKLDLLTPREREVMQLIAEGYTTKEVAGKLNISARTADVHRTHIMQKLEVHNVAGLTRMAVAYGLVNLPDSL
jgi:DNA-binding NarL/FixJ family response regulator